jgi:hypothetical protein
MEIGKQASKRSLERIGSQDKEKSTREEHLVSTAGKPTAQLFSSKELEPIKKRAFGPFF